MQKIRQPAPKQLNYNLIGKPLGGQVKQYTSKYKVIGQVHRYKVVYGTYLLVQATAV